MVRLALFACLPVLFLGCADDLAEPVEVAESVEAPAELSMAKAPRTYKRPLAKLPRFNESRISSMPENDCIICGRETGFRGRPDLHADVRDKIIELSWTEMEGADFYTVHATQWSDDASPLNSFSWRTSGPSLSVEMDAGFRYAFHVYAWANDPKRRSEASEVVDVEL